MSCRLLVADDSHFPIHSVVSDVVDALKNIQDRIRALEVERTTAEENLKDLSKETNFYRQSLERIRQQSPRTPKSVSPRAADAGYDHTTLSGHSPRRPSSRHQHGEYIISAV